MSISDAFHFLANFQIDFTMKILTILETIFHPPLVQLIVSFPMSYNLKFASSFASLLFSIDTLQFSPPSFSSATVFTVVNHSSPEFPSIFGLVISSHPGCTCRADHCLTSSL